MLKRYRGWGKKLGYALHQNNGEPVSQSVHLEVQLEGRVKLVKAEMITEAVTSVVGFSLGSSLPMPTPPSCSWARYPWQQLRPVTPVGCAHVNAQSLAGLHIFSIDELAKSNSKCLSIVSDSGRIAKRFYLLMGSVNSRDNCLKVLESMRLSLQIPPSEARVINVVVKMVRAFFHSVFP